MNVKLKVKSISKLRDCLTYENYVTAAFTVEQLIREMVRINVEKFNKSRNLNELILLDEETCNAMAKIGKVSFGGKNNKRKVDVLIMQEEAIFQFKNNRFKIINETQKREYTTVDERLELMENDSLVFIKLAMLAGRRF